MTVLLPKQARMQVVIASRFWVYGSFLSVSRSSNGQILLNTQQVGNDTAFYQLC